MTDPCERCKRARCPERCFPKIDYKRGLRKNGRNNKQQGKAKKGTVL